MCFVFVFVALLEYAAVNYFFWGARAKKKKKQKHRAAVTVGSNAMTSSNYQTAYSGQANGRATIVNEERKVNIVVRAIYEMCIANRSLYQFSLFMSCYQIFVQHFTATSSLCNISSLYN